MTVMANTKEERFEQSDSEDEILEENTNSKEESSNESTTESVEGAESANAAWASSIAKILKTNKPKKKKTLVLSKAKKLTDVQPVKVKSVGFQIETKDGEIKEEKIIEESQQIVKTDKLPRKKKKELPDLRVKPNVLEKDRERTLTKIATRGVVQLFNAVKAQQKDIKNKLEEAGPLEVRKEKVLKSVDKRAFLDVLMGEKSLPVPESSSISKKIEKEENEKTWSVLRDDFMMGAKLKDWDKEMEVEDNTELE